MDINDLGRVASPNRLSSTTEPASSLGPARFRVDERAAGVIEGYALACDDLLLALTGDSGSAKSYDPATVDVRRQVVHSYAFDMKDGGRHHPIADYASLAELLAYIRRQTIDDVCHGVVPMSDHARITRRSDDLTSFFERYRDRDGTPMPDSAELQTGITCGEARQILGRIRKLEADIRSYEKTMEAIAQSGDSARIVELTEALAFIAEGRVPSGRERNYARDVLRGEG